MVHLSFGHEGARSPHLLSEPAIIAGMAHGHPARHEDPVGRLRRATTTASATRWPQALDGFEDFNRRVRQPLGFRIRQPARERVFLTAIGPRRVLARAAAGRGPARRHG